MYKKQQEVKVYLYRTQTEEQKTGEAWERGYYYVAIKYAIKDGSKFMLRHGPNPSSSRGLEASPLKRHNDVFLKK